MDLCRFALRPVQEPSINTLPPRRSGTLLYKDPKHRAFTPKGYTSARRPYGVSRRGVKEEEKEGATVLPLHTPICHRLCGSCTNDREDMWGKMFL